MGLGLAALWVGLGLLAALSMAAILVCDAVVLASDAGRWHFGTLRGGGRCAAGWGHWVGLGLAAFRLAGSLILLVFACAAGRWHFGTLRAAARQATLRCG